MSRRDFGNVRKLPSGRWQARYFDASGRRHQRTFPSTGDAGRFLAGVRADLDRGGWIDPRAGQVQLREYSRVCNHSGRRPEWLSAVRDLRNTGTGRESVRSAHHQINLDGPQTGDRRASVIMPPALFRAPQVPVHTFTRPASRFLWCWPCQPDRGHQPTHRQRRYRRQDQGAAPSQAPG